MEGGLWMLTPSLTEKDGIIEPDSEIGKLLGFTSDKFDGYLWRKLALKFLHHWGRFNLYFLYH